MVKTVFGQTKKKARIILKSAIEKWISEPSSARVVGFPGYHAKEITEIYDPLGFSRRNITGVERDKQVYNHLSNEDNGIDLYFGEIDEFLNGGEVFDVVSMDYTGMQNRANVSLVRDCFEKKQFASRAVLHTNYYASRINAFTEKGLPYVSQFRKSDVRGYKEEGYSNTYFWQLIKDKDIMSLKDFKSHALTCALVLCSMTKDHDIFKKVLESQCAESEIDVMDYIVENEKISYSQRKTFALPRVPAITEYTYCGRKFHINAVEQNAMNVALMDLSREYVIKDAERFMYVSDDGSLMFSDILFIEDGLEYIEDIRSFVKGRDSSDNLIMKGHGREYARNKKRFEKAVRRYSRELRKKYDFLLPSTCPRVDITLPKITIDELVQLITDGRDTDWILENYQGFDRGQVAAYRAHVTRGTFGLLNEECDNNLVDTVECTCEIKPKDEEIHLIPRKFYKKMERASQKRVEYFMDEVYNQVGVGRKEKIRQAFLGSRMRKVIDPNMDKYRVYAFFDDLSLLVKSRKKINSEIIDNIFLKVRDAGNLIEVVKLKKNNKKVSVSEVIKEEVRALVCSGISKEEIWEAYADQFESRKQFGSVIAWCSGKLKNRRKII